MADTIRTLSTLQSLLADNTTGDISPQDLRDLLVSVSMQHGQIWVSGNATATTISDTTSYFESNWTGSALAGQSSILGTDDFDMPAAGRLRYLGTATRAFHVACTISFTAASNNQVLYFRLAKNGTVSAQNEVVNKVAISGDIQSTALHWVVMLSQNDYVSLFVRNSTQASNITVASGNLQAVGMIM